MTIGMRENGKFISNQEMNEDPQGLMPLASQIVELAAQNQDENQMMVGDYDNHYTQLELQQQQLEQEREMMYQS